MTSKRKFAVIEVKLSGVCCIVYIVSSSSFIDIIDPTLHRDHGRGIPFAACILVSCSATRLLADPHSCAANTPSSRDSPGRSWAEIDILIGPRTAAVISTVEFCAWIFAGPMTTAVTS